MTTENRRLEIRQLVTKQCKELDVTPGSPEDKLRVSLLMLVIVEKLADFKSEHRKLVIKFLIETDEVLDKLDET